MYFLSDEVRMRHFFISNLYSKNQKTIAMIQSHHRILSIDSSHCVTWFIELFFLLLYI